MCHRQMFFTLGNFIAIVGALLLVVFVSEYAQPFHYGKSFVATTCTYVHFNYTGANVCCTPKCTFTYPCAAVTVSYSAGGSTVQGYLRQNYRTVSRDKDGKCALWSCDTVTSNNVASVQAYVDSVTDQTFTCHYNPDSTTEVIMENVHFTAIIHSVIWPTLTLIAGLVLVGLTQIQSITCWRDDVKPGEDDDDDDDKKKIADEEAAAGGVDNEGLENDETSVMNEDDSKDEEKPANGVEGSKLSVGGEGKSRANTAASAAETTTTTVSHA